MSKESLKLSKDLKAKKEKLDSFIIDFEYQSNNIDDIVQGKKDESKGLDSLIDSKENECISWERKLVKVKSSVEEEKKSIERIKVNFEKWKINVLEGVARLKIKNKIESIDKAGLSEVLNG